MCARLNHNRRHDILVTAGKLYAKFGLRGTTINDVARYSHVSKKTVYNYFSSKDELFFEVVRNEAETLFKYIQDAVDRENTIRGKIKAYFLAKNQKILELGNLYNITRETMINLLPYLEKAAEAHKEQDRKIVMDILAQGIETGELSIPDPELTAGFLAKSLTWMDPPWVTKGRKFFVEEDVDKIVDVLLRGILTR
jgi:AcrR family transcriptional regulator